MFSKYIVEYVNKLYYGENHSCKLIFHNYDPSKVIKLNTFIKGEMTQCYSSVTVTTLIHGATIMRDDMSFMTYVNRETGP